MLLLVVLQINPHHGKFQPPTFRIFKVCEFLVLINLVYNTSIFAIHLSTHAAAEIDCGKEDSQDEMQQLHEISPYHIRSRLQHMELELSSALHSLRSKSSHTLNSEVSNCFLLSSSCDHFFVM
jgi:hypothetical protein